MNILRKTFLFIFCSEIVTVQCADDADNTGDLSPLYSRANDEND